MEQFSYPVVDYMSVSVLCTEHWACKNKVYVNAGAYLRLSSELHTPTSKASIKKPRWLHPFENSTMLKSIAFEGVRNMRSVLSAYISVKSENGLHLFKIPRSAKHRSVLL